MKFTTELNVELDEIFVDFEQTLQDIAKDELIRAIRESLRDHFKHNVEFVGAMRKFREKAAQRIIDSIMLIKED